MAALIEQVAGALQGQCVRSLEQVCEDLDIEDTQELRLGVDNLVFECPTCGWWCEASEQADDEGNCDDCADEKLMDEGDDDDV